ncbi:MAG: hypothetical protein Crog4KO_09500 [Crocinitomicaceae bacterium]
MKINIALFILLASIVAASCTVQKRVHRKGWYVQWHFDKKDSKNQSENSKNTESKAVTTISESSSVNSITEKQRLSVQIITEDNLSQAALKPDSTNRAATKASIATSNKKSHADSTPQKKGRSPGFFIPIITFLASTIAVAVVISTFGFPPILVSIILSALIALCIFFVTQKNWQDYPEDEARRKIRNNLILMFVLIGLAFAFVTVFSITAIPSWIGFTLVLLLAFTVLIIASTNQRKRDELQELEKPKPVEKEHPIKEPENSEVTATIIRPMTKGEAFPNLIASISIFLALFLVIGIILILLAGTASLLGIAIVGPYFYLALIFAALFLFVALSLSIRLNTSYSQYIRDLRQEQRNKESEVENGTNTNYQEDTAPDRGERNKADNRTAVAAAIVMTLSVIMLTVFLLLQ